MIPPNMMQIDAIPFNSNGKLDKNLLPVISNTNKIEYCAPRNEIDAALIETFETGICIPLKTIFSHPTPEQLASVASAGTDEYEPIPKAAEKKYYSMSSAQKRLYILHEMEPDSLIYNMSGSVTLHGKADTERVKAALQKLINRHEILRTQFITVNGEPVQKILDYVEADFEYCSSDRNDAELVEEHIRPFDLGALPLIRTKLIEKKDYCLLVFDMHHIISDAMSAEILISELMTMYNGGQPDEMTHQFKDYSE